MKVLGLLLGWAIKMGLEHIEHLEYREAGNILTVTFRGGTVWDYHPVNPEIYAEIIRADSLHRAVNRLIRDGKTVGIKRNVGH